MGGRLEEGEGDGEGQASGASGVTSPGGVYLPFRNFSAPRKSWQWQLVGEAASRKERATVRARRVGLVEQLFRAGDIYLSGTFPPPGKVGSGNGGGGRLEEGEGNGEGEASGASGATFPGGDRAGIFTFPELFRPPEKLGDNKENDAAATRAVGESRGRSNFSTTLKP